jgi:hypothetical protein
VLFGSYDASFLFCSLMPAAFPKLAVPLRATWDFCCRISTLQDGNSDRDARMTLDIFWQNGTKSPRSAAVPILQVIQGVSNLVFIPTISFDK